MGLSLSAVLNTYLRRFLHTDEVQFIEELQPSEYLKKSIREAEEDIRAGRTIRFDSFEEEVEYLDKLINNGQKRHKKEN